MISALIPRPRGWHLDERHVTVDGQPVAGALFDFGLYLFHNADAAIADFSEAITHDRRYASAYFNRANAYAAKGEADRAIADYTAAIKHNRRNVNAYIARETAIGSMINFVIGSAFFFGKPLKVLVVIWNWFTGGKIYEHLAYTLWETLLAFAIGTLLGLMCGLWLALAPTALPSALTPYLATASKSAMVSMPSRLSSSTTINS